MRMRIQHWVIAALGVLVLSTNASAALVAHWPLDDGGGLTATEVQGGFDGDVEVGGALITGDGDRGNVLELDGATGRVELSDHISSFNGMTTGTVVGWFKHNSTSIGSLLTLSNSNTGSTEARLFIENNRVRYDVRDAGGDPTGEAGMMASAEGVSDGVWRHIAVSVDGSGEVTKIYVDGTLVGKSYEPLWGNITDATSVLDTMAMGNNTDSGGGQWFFNGRMSDVAVYDGVLTPGQVLDVMQNGVSSSPNDPGAPTPRPSGTLAYYKFNEKAPGSPAGIGDPIVDETGNHDGSFVADTVSYANGLDGSALRFTDDAEGSHRVEVPTSEDLWVLPDESFTVESIFKTTATGTRGIASKNGNGGEFWMRLQEGEVRFFVSDGVSPAVDVQSDDAEGEVANTGEWVHVAGVYDAAAEELRLYIDGMLVDTDVAPASFAAPLNGDTNPLVIGDFVGTNSRKFIGDIDMVRLTRGALTPDEFILVPEPATLLLVGLGLCGVSLVRRRVR